MQTAVYIDGSVFRDFWTYSLVVYRNTPCVSRETVYNTGYGNEPLLQLNLLLCYCIDPLILAILFRDKPSVISIMSRGVLLKPSDCEFIRHFMPT